ncbi:glycine hydroxymethyltransferase [Jiella endophytica]|uniref:glycine hydroxymethyltransferase n=1 Tax=Jiella endophytica TaxID=2558362 RepID=UPI001430D378|nr:glycine hydroxymethyltransferase [Jiella endophytica]
MTRTDLFDDLDGLGGDGLKAELAARVARHARGLREERLILYAGANILTADIAAAFDPALSLMPAMGPPEDKEQPGSDFVASLEALASRLACKVFKAGWADCRLPSCTIANLAAFACFAARGDLVLAPAAADGGHLSQRRGGTPTVLGLAVEDLPFDTGCQRLDSEAAARDIRRLRPALVVLGRSVILGPDDLEPVVSACRDVGALSLYDASHVAGLIAGGVFANPFEAGVDLMTTSTYKTLAGPTGAIVLGRDESHGARFADFLDMALLANQNAARLGPLCGVLAEFAETGAYAALTVDLADRLKRNFVAAGLPVLLPDEPARTHQVVVPVGDLDMTRRIMAELEAADILVGRCPVPGAPRQHGLRFGSQLVARQRFEDPDRTFTASTSSCPGEAQALTRSLVAAIGTFLDTL